MALMKNIAASRNFRGFDFHISRSDMANLSIKIDRLSADIRNKATGKALSRGGKVFIMEAKRRVTSDRVEAGIRGTLRTKGGVKGYIAGPSAGLPSPYWLEYGTLDKYVGHGRGKGGYTVRRTKRFRAADGTFVTIRAGHRITSGIRPRPFLQPSFDAKYPAMINEMAQTLEKEIIKHGK